MDESSVVSEVENGVATVRLNRPAKRNALTRESLLALLSALETVATDQRVRVVVLRGEGKAFCAGMDLAEMLAMREQRGWFDYELLPEVLEQVAALPVPSIAIVQGSAIAGGCELALHCDIRVGTPDAIFAMPLARLGMVAPAYAIQRLIDTVGISAARDLLLSAELVNAEHALRLGLLTRLVASHDVEQAVGSLAAQIASFAPLALREMKRAVATLAPKLSPDVRLELDRGRLEVSRSSDLREGLTAFLERRRPNFLGQ